MKKSVALLLIVAMLVAMLTGCMQRIDLTPLCEVLFPTTQPGASSGVESTEGGETEAPEVPATTTGGAAPVQTTTVSEVDIESWIIDEDKRDYTGTVEARSAFKLSQGMQEMIEEFNSYYPNITINWGSFNNTSDGNAAINAELAKGEIDVLVSFGLNYTSARWKDGLFLDITDKLEKENIDLVANWGTDGYNLNGHYYSLPCGGLQYYVVVNMTAWKNAGLGELPTEWTWDEYIEACRRMTKKDGDKVVMYGGSSYSSINTILYCTSQVTGTDLYLNEDDYTSNYNNPITIKAFERELKCELEEKIWFPLATYRNDGRKDYDTFLKKEIASAVTCNIVRYIHDPKYEETSNFITGFAPFPTEEKGQTNYQAGVHTYSHVAVASKCQDETAAWLFAKYYATYGVKYLCKAGHQTHWKGTDTSEYLNILYGSEANAKKYIDVESFLHVVGRNDLPSWVESTSQFNVKTYSDHTGFLKDPLMKALAGELTAKQALEQAAKEANAYLKQQMSG